LIKLTGFQDFAKIIFKELSFEDLLNCRVVCQTFYNHLINDRDLWISKLKDLVVKYYNFLDEDKSGGYKRFREEWKVFLEKLYEEGDINDIFTVSLKFLKVLNGRPTNKDGKISDVFGQYLFDSIIYFKDLKIYKMLIKFGFKHYNDHSDFFPIELFSALDDILRPLEKEKFDELIDLTKEMDYIWFNWEFKRVLGQMIESEDAYRVERLLEMKENMEYDDYDWKQQVPPLFRLAIQTCDLKIFQLVTDFLGTDFDEKIEEITYPRGQWIDKELKGHYPLHAAAKLGNMEIFEYIYSRVTEKRPMMSIWGLGRCLPHRLADGKFREELEEKYYPPKKTTKRKKSSAGTGGKKRVFMFF